jgi:hypothetical protein
VISPAFYRQLELQRSWPDWRARCEGRACSPPLPARNLDGRSCRRGEPDGATAAVILASRLDSDRVRVAARLSAVRRTERSPEARDGDGMRATPGPRENRSLSRYGAVSRSATVFTRSPTRMMAQLAVMNLNLKYLASAPACIHACAHTGIPSHDASLRSR